MNTRLLVSSLLLSAPALAQDGQVELVADPAPSQRRPADERTLVVHDVSDLTGQAELVAPGVPALDGADAEQARELLEALRAHEQQRTAVHARAETLLGAVRAYMQPAFEQGRHELNLLNDGCVLLLGEPEQQEWVKTFLTCQRSTTGLVLIDARMMTVPAGTMARLGVQGSASVFAGEDEFAPIVRALAADPGTEIINTPRLAFHPGSRGNIQVTNQVAYVKDYKVVVVEPGAVEIADPVVDVVQEGVTLDVWAVPLAEGLFGLEVEMQQATLQRPIPTATLRIGAGRHEVQIGQPQVTRVGVETRLALRDGAVAVLITPDPTRDLDVLVSIRLRHLDEDALEQELGAGKR